MLQSLLTKYRSNLKLLLLLFFAIIFRVSLTPLVIHDDLLSNAGWSQRIGQNGPLGFYEHEIWIFSWPTQPPLVSLIYGFSWHLYLFLSAVIAHSSQIIKLDFLVEFSNNFSSLVAPNKPYPLGIFISIKLIAIFGDVLLALALYFFSKKKSILLPAIYLLLPFSWYLSAIWGQFDQLAVALCLFSFLLLGKHSTFSPLFLVLSISIKPTTAIFLPIYSYFYFRQKPKFTSIVLALFLSVLMVFATIKPFTTQNPYTYLTKVLKTKILDKSDPRVTSNSFNFWRIATGERPRHHDEVLFLIPTKFWGYLAVILLNLFCLKRCKNLETKNIAIIFFIVGFGTWIFATGMLDRYLFAGTIGLLLLYSYNSKLLLPSLFASIIFLLNLYNQFFFPEIPILKSFLQNETNVGVLSFLNTLIFLYISFNLH